MSHAGKSADVYYCGAFHPLSQMPGLTPFFLFMIMPSFNRRQKRNKRLLEKDQVS